MRSLVALAAFALLLAAVSAQEAFKCPADYVPADSCTLGPCRCAMFRTISIATNPTTRATTIKIRATNVCKDPVYYVQFSISSTSGMTITPQTSGTYTSGSTSGYQWTVSQFDGRTGANATNPPLRWLRFTAVNGPNTKYAIDSTSLNWEEFTFVVRPPFPFPPPAPIGPPSPLSQQFLLYIILVLLFPFSFPRSPSFPFVAPQLTAPSALPGPSSSKFFHFLTNKNISRRLFRFLLCLTCQLTYPSLLPP